MHVYLRIVFFYFNCVRWWLRLGGYIKFICIINLRLLWYQLCIQSLFASDSRIESRVKTSGFKYMGQFEVGCLYLLAICGGYSIFIVSKHGRLNWLQERYALKELGNDLLIAIQKSLFEVAVLSVRPQHVLNRWSRRAMGLYSFWLN